MPYKVVIAEDFRMIREIFESTVQRAEGYTLAASFPTAVQAVGYIEKNNADLVLMDVLIPGSMSGLNAAEKIKAIKPDVKIIVVTSMPELSYERKAREIAEKLNIGESTVKMHITNMLQKSGFHSRLELALMARHYGIAINERMD